MGIVREGAPEELMLFVQRTFGINVFIETGTFKGATSSWAADHFKKVFSIELSKELFDEAVAKYQHIRNINFQYGDSSEALVKIIKQLNESAVFWLDAHHCSLNTAGKGSRAPISDEICAISSSAYDHFIFIDDARLFMAPPPDPHFLGEYPDIYTLLEHLNRYKMHYILIYDDVIVCVPESAKKLVSEFSKREITHNYKMYLADKTNRIQNKYSKRFVPRFKDSLKKVIDYFIKKRNDSRKLGKFRDDFNEFHALNKRNHRFSCHWEERYPCLDDATVNTTYDRHYVLHPAWAMRILVQNMPDLHIDIGSTLRFVAQLSSLITVKHYDYRPPLISIENLECAQADLTNLQFTENSIGSLSCMHTIEHIGLGRYGDPLDSEGDKKAASELTRVLTPKGNLLVVVPVGRSKVAFNAHRIYSYRQVQNLFPNLQLKQYALIPDSHESGDILYGASEMLTDSQDYGCGCFWFTKV
ncbi:MAG: DUF268 domain-containing protein [Pseudomonadota bacterium]